MEGKRKMGGRGRQRGGFSDRARLEESEVSLLSILTLANSYTW